MTLEIDDNKIESICYKGKYGKKFIIFLEDGVVTDIVDTGAVSEETTPDNLNAEREEIITALKSLNAAPVINDLDDKTTTTQKGSDIKYCQS